MSNLIVIGFNNQADAFEMHAALAQRMGSRRVKKSRNHAAFSMSGGKPRHRTKGR